jgi:hypothetical protein
MCAVHWLPHKSKTFQKLLLLPALGENWAGGQENFSWIPLLLRCSQSSIDLPLPSEDEPTLLLATTAFWQQYWHSISNSTNRRPLWCLPVAPSYEQLTWLESKPPHLVLGLSYGQYPKIRNVTFKFFNG